MLLIIIYTPSHAKPFQKNERPFWKKEKNKNWHKNEIRKGINTF